MPIGSRKVQKRKGKSIGVPSPDDEPSYYCWPQESNPWPVRLRAFPFLLIIERLEWARATVCSLPPGSLWIPDHHPRPQVAHQAYQVSHVWFVTQRVSVDMMSIGFHICVGDLVGLWNLAFMAEMKLKLQLLVSSHCIAIISPGLCMWWDENAWIILAPKPEPVLPWKGTVCVCSSIWCGEFENGPEG